MKLFESARSHLEITRAHGIVRRYFVVNGFDGALTMLGLVIGFIASDVSDLTVVINACLAAAIALAVSGMSSAYVSESAERRRALGALEDAMLTDLGGTTHGHAARRVPVLVALINGASPLLFALIIISPMYLARGGVTLPVAPLIAAVMAAVLVIFLLGAYLGRVAGISWLRSGLRTLLIAGATVVLIYVFTSV